MSIKHLGLVTGDAFSSNISITATVIDKEDVGMFSSSEYRVTTKDCQDG